MDKRIQGLVHARGLRWLVPARNQIQSLMLALFERWDGMDDRTRQLCLGMSFSLWRACFLIHERARKRGAKPAPQGLRALRALQKLQAREFLTKVIEANAITFADDDRYRDWSAGYYVNNAIYRACDVAGVKCEDQLRNIAIRYRWLAAFEYLLLTVETKGRRDKPLKLQGTLLGKILGLTGTSPVQPAKTKTVFRSR